MYLSEHVQHTLTGVRFWKKNSLVTSLALAETCLGSIISSDVESHTAMAEIIDLTQT